MECARVVFTAVHYGRKQLEAETDEVHLGGKMDALAPGLVARSDGNGT